MESKTSIERSKTIIRRIANKLKRNEKLTLSDFDYMKNNHNFFEDFKFRKNRKSIM